MESNKNQFISQLLASSNSKVYNEAILEWFPNGASIFPNFCICGHSIVENCHITNSINGNELIVGNVCIDKFMSNLSDEKDKFIEILKVSIGKKASISKNTLLYLLNINTISEWEYSFLLSIGSKRKLSDKQIIRKDDIYSRIYKKIIRNRETTYNRSIEKIKLESILLWCESNKWWNKSFVESCNSYYDRHLILSNKQEASINGIIDRFKIPILY